MPDDIRTAIEEDAQAPKSATSDGTTVTQHGLQDQIAADRYLSSKAASNKTTGLGIKRTKMVPPGAV